MRLKKEWHDCCYANALASVHVFESVVITIVSGLRDHDWVRVLARSCYVELDGFITRSSRGVAYGLAYQHASPSR
jgi:hypothetical protein